MSIGSFFRDVSATGMDGDLKIFSSLVVKEWRNLGGLNAAGL
jgi:hypothetical protein